MWRIRRDAHLHEVPLAHWRRILTNNAIERLNREIRRRTLVVGIFPDAKSALVLATARLKCIAESEWAREGILMSRCWTSSHAGCGHLAAQSAQES